MKTYKYLRKLKARLKVLTQAIVEIKDSFQYSYHEGEPWSFNLVLTKLPWILCRLALPFLYYWGRVSLRAVSKDNVSYHTSQVTGNRTFKHPYYRFLSRKTRVQIVAQNWLSCFRILRGFPPSFQTNGRCNLKLGPCVGLYLLGFICSLVILILDAI